MSGDAQMALFGGGDLDDDASVESFVESALPRVALDGVKPRDIGAPVGLRDGLVKIADNLFYGVTADEYAGKNAACVASAYCAALRQLGLEIRGHDADILHEMIRSGRQRIGRGGMTAKTVVGVATLASMKGVSVRYQGARTWSPKGYPGSRDLIFKDDVSDDLWGLAQCLADEGFGVGAIQVPRHLMAYRLLSGGGIAIIDNGGWESKLPRWKTDNVKCALGIALR